MTPSNKPKLHDLKAHKMPDQSTLYDKIIPVMFVLLGLITLVLIGFSVGVLTGLIHWS
jgi:hypothetical protein